MITARHLSHVYGQPWNIAPLEWYARLHAPVVAAIKRGDLARLASSDSATPEQREPLAKRPALDWYGNAIQQLQIIEGTAIVPIKGVLVSGATAYEKKSGDYCDYADVHEDLDNAAAANVKQILLDVDSPGGSVMGCAELASRIAGILASGINIEARTAGLMCSAAYYACAGVRAIRATPSAFVGSIGTIWETINIADLLAELGIEWSVFTSGPLKGTGHPAKKLSDAQRDYMQGMVNTLAGEFKGFVRAHRPRVQEDAMQGQAMTGRQAAAAGLVDALLLR